MWTCITSRYLEDIEMKDKTWWVQGHNTVSISDATVLYQNSDSLCVVFLNNFIKPLNVMKTNQQNPNHAEIHSSILDNLKWGLVWTVMYTVI